MAIDIKQHLYLKVEMDGTSQVVVFEGDMRSCTIQALQLMLRPETRWTKRDSNPQMLWSWSKQPFPSMAKGLESTLQRANEIAAGLDLSDVEIIDDSELEAMRAPWLVDDRIRRLIQINTSKEEFDASTPSERSELLSYAQSIWPEFFDSFEKKWLA